jgi:hypothetical protein
MRPTTALLPLAALLALAGCASRYQTITHPPRINLTQHELIGVVEFSSPEERKLAPMVTARFTEAARRDQGMVRMLGLQGERARPDTERVRELARKHGLRTIVVGELRLSDVQPSVSLSSSLSSGSLTATVEGVLSVEMIETETGASLWSASARSKECLGSVHVQGNGVRDVAIDAAGPDAAYAALVDRLVSQVTRDLQSTWERRRLP